MRPELSYRCRQTANELAATFGLATLYGDWHTVHSKCAVGSDDLINSVRLTAWVGLWTVDAIAEPSNCPSANVVSRGTSDDSSTMVGFVSYRNYL
jgi:hypothetical protein